MPKDLSYRDMPLTEVVKTLERFQPSHVSARFWGIPLNLKNPRQSLLAQPYANFFDCVPIGQIPEDYSLTLDPKKITAVNPEHSVVGPIREEKPKLYFYTDRLMDLSERRLIDNFIFDMLSSFPQFKKLAGEIMRANLNQPQLIWLPEGASYTGRLIENCQDRLRFPSSQIMFDLFGPITFNGYYIQPMHSKFLYSSAIDRLEDLIQGTERVTITKRKSVG